MTVKVPEIDIFKEKRGPFEKEKTKTQKTVEYLQSLKPTKEQWEALSQEEKNQVEEAKSSIDIRDDDALNIPEEIRENKYDMAKREASMAIAEEFKGIMWLSSIHDRITINPFPKSVIAQRRGEEGEEV